MNNNSMIEQTLGGAPQQGGENETMFLTVINELAELEAAGQLPEGFDLRSACQDATFAELLLELPALAAARVYMAEQKAGQAEKNARADAAARMQERRALPRMSRAGGTVSPQPDYMSMSSEEFRALEQQLKRMSQRGRTVRV